GRALLTRPAAAITWTGRCRRSRARAAEVTTSAVALSVSRQQSRRWSGFTTQREARTSATVTGVLRRALGLLAAWLEWAAFTWATCADVVPYSYMWRVKTGAKRWPALSIP